MYNGVVYLAGQVADDESADVSGQTAQVLAQVDAMLAKAGSDKSRILMMQIFLADIAGAALQEESVFVVVSRLAGSRDSRWAQTSPS